MENTNKNIVIETEEVSEILLKTLNDKSNTFYLRDGNETVEILLDEGAVILLKAHYTNKSRKVI